MELADKSSSPQAIAVLGAGSWGTALALLLASNQHRVALWSHKPNHVKRMQAQGDNREFLPGCSFPDTLAATSDFEYLARSHRKFLIVVPSHAFRSTLEKLVATGVDRKSLIGWGTKGFDPENSILLSEVVAEVLGPECRRAVVSGPTFAREVACGLPTALTVAADDVNIAEQMATMLRNQKVRVYTNDDLPGVQLGGAIKNIMAIAAGISDGLGFGANARAALITRGLAEMTRLGLALGGKPHTFMGLTGVGDLVLTCTDDQSRNRQLGVGLGQGQSLKQIHDEIGQEVEGILTVRELHQLAQRLKIEMPITEQVYRVVHGGIDPRHAVEALLQRDPRAE